MKLAIVKKLTHFYRNAAIDSFHYVMFHGLARRQTAPTARMTNLVDDIQDRPLCLQVNAYRHHHITQPDSRLLISEQLKDEIGPIPDTLFLPTILTKVVEIPYSEFNFSHWDDPAYQDDGTGPDQIIEQAPNQPEPAVALGSVFEMVCPKYTDIATKLSNGIDIDVDMVPTPYDPRFAIAISNQMLSEYPIFWHKGNHFISEPIFSKLKEYFNWNYFILKEVIV